MCLGVRALNKFKSSIVFLVILFFAYVTPAYSQSPLESVDSKDLVGKIVELSGNEDKKEELGIYFKEVLDRVAKQEPFAMHYFGWYQYQLCKSYREIGVKAVSEKMCVKALSNFKKVAANPAIQFRYISSESMYLLGEMYLEGMGSEASKYIAADWFGKSAKQRYQIGNREGAMRAMGKSLELIPDNPSLIELRDQVLRE